MEEQNNSVKKENDFSSKKTMSCNPDQFDFKIDGIIPGIPKDKVIREAMQDYDERIICKKLSKNDLTNYKDLYIEINSPIRVKGKGFFSSYAQYDIVTFPINYNVQRKLSDIEFLYETLPNFNKAKFNPLLPKFPRGLDDDSDKKLLQ